MKNVIGAMMAGLENALGFTRYSPPEVPDGYTIFRNFRNTTSGDTRRVKKPRRKARSNPWMRGESWKRRYNK